MSAFAGTVTAHTGAVMLTTSHNLAQLKAINNATSGQITLQNYAVALSGTSADVSAALSGSLGRNTRGL